MINYYKVGGCVRDKILGFKSKDIDYAVEAETFEAMKADILSKGGIIFVEKPEYLTIRAKSQGEAVDFVLCRKDGAYYDGRHPETVTPGTIDDDLARRDFTMNAIAERSDGSFYDPHGGIVDINKRLIKCVGEAEERFKEDSLRILRAIRFAITKGFKLDYDIISLIERWFIVTELESVSSDRIREELNKCFAADTMETLKYLQAFPYIRQVIFERDNLSLEVKQTN